LVEKPEHCVLVEMSAAEIRFSPGPEFELFLSKQLGHVEPEVSEVTHPACPLFRIDEVEQLLAMRHTIADEGVEKPIFLVLAVDERADVTIWIQYPSGE
jgi:hypothetical protein